MDSFSILVYVESSGKMEERKVVLLNVPCMFVLYLYFMENVTFLLCETWVAHPEDVDEGVDTFTKDVEELNKNQ